MVELAQELKAGVPHAAASEEYVVKQKSNRCDDQQQLENQIARDLDNTYLSKGRKQSDA